MRTKLRTLRNALRQQPSQSLKFPTEPPAAPAPNLVTPKLAHRAIKIDYYPTGETSRSIRAAYERAYGGNRRMPGVYSPRDWARLSFALDQTIKGSSVLDVGANRGQFVRIGQRGDRGTAGVDGTAQQAVARDGVVEAQQAFADALGVGVEHAVGDVVAQGADVGDVVVEAFEPCCMP